MKEVNFSMDQMVALAERCAMYEYSWKLELSNKNGLLEANRGLSKIIREAQDAKGKLEKEVSELQNALKKATRVVADSVVTYKKPICTLPAKFTTPEDFALFYAGLVPEIGPVPSWFAEIQGYITELKDKSIVPACKAFREATGIGLMQARSFIIWYAFKYHNVLLGTKE
jgi:hypothetical protein